MNESSNEITRKALYELVWSKPMFRISTQFNVSGSYLTRVCNRLKVPLPGRGYWARIAAGEKILRPALPETQPGDEIVWIKGGCSVFLPKQPIKHHIELNKLKSESLKIPSSKHPLLIGIKAHFKAGRRPCEYSYLKPSKRLLIDVLATEACLDKAMSFANKLYSSLDSFGYKVCIASATESLTRVPPKELENSLDFHNFETPWSPFRATVFHLGTVAIGLTIFEIFEEAEARYENGQYVKINQGANAGKNRYSRTPPWTTKNHFPTGKLCLQAYSPYPRVKWTKQWKEDKCGLTGRITEIIKNIEHEAPDILIKLNEAEKQAENERKEREAQHKLWRAQFERQQKEQAEQERKKAQENSRKELLRIIDVWDEVTRIERFIEDVEQKSISLDDINKQKVIDRLKAARVFIGSNDALDHFLTWKTPKE